MGVDACSWKVASTTLDHICLIPHITHLNHHLMSGKMELSKSKLLLKKAGLSKGPGFYFLFLRRKIESVDGGLVALSRLEQNFGEQ